MSIKIGKVCGSCIFFEHDIVECFGLCLRQFKIAPNPKYKEPLYLNVELYFACELWERDPRVFVDNI